MKVCVYTICKNEIKYIDRWLDSVKDADYICILDTGSTDGTWEKIKNNPKIISKQQIFPEFNFGLAKTMAFQLCPSDTDICITIDIDEYFSQNWYNTLLENYENAPVRCPYFTGKNSTKLSSKYIAHPYNESIIWKYPIFEEPAYWNGEFYSSYWSYIDTYCTQLDKIFVYHTQDSDKVRNYDPLIKSKILENFKRITTPNISYEETCQIMYSTIEAFDKFKSEYTFYIKEFLRLLFERRDTYITSLGKSINDIDYDSEKYFLYLTQEYNKMLGFFESALGFSNIIVNRGKELKEGDIDLIYQILSQDSIPVFLAIGDLKTAYSIAAKNVLNKKEISEVIDLIRINMGLEWIHYLENSFTLPKKLMPNLSAQVNNSIIQLKETNKFAPFRIS